MQHDTQLTTRARRLGCDQAWRVVIVPRDGSPRWALDIAPGRLVDLGCNPAEASRALSVLAGGGWRLPEAGLPPEGDLLLTPTQASALYEQLTGRRLQRQRWQQWAARGDVESASVLVVQRVIPAAEVERLAREGLPDRGDGGRPRRGAAN